MRIRLNKKSSSKLSIARINDKIVLLTFPSQEEMVMSLIRIQEFYECPCDKFRAGPFTLKEYKIWYTEKYGGFDYPYIVDGMNIPFDYFKPFITGDFNPLTPEEHEVITMVENLSDDTYIIAVYDGVDSATYEHELSHSMYGTDKLYKRRINAILRKYDKKLGSVKKFLKKIGYSSDKLKDEIHAFCLADFMYLRDCGVDFPHEMTKELIMVKAEFLPKPYNPSEILND